MAATAAGLDYYSILGISQDSSSDDIKKSYRKLAMKFHPEKNTSHDASEKFRKISEAFDVLNDAKKRAIYDQFGEDGLKNGVPGKDGFEGYPGGYHFNGRPEEVFSKFFGSNNVYQDLFNYDMTSSLFGKKFGGLNGMNQQALFQGPVQSPAVEQPLPLTLEELYLGTVKKLKISKSVLTNDGTTTTTKEKILSIKIKRGWKTGTRITFPKEGDQGANVIPGDIIFIIDEKPHERFKRDGNDLHYTAKVGLAQALTGVVISIQTLDDRNLNFNFTDVINPHVTKTIPNEGMPLSSDPESKGNLVIHFDIQFPKYLNETEKKNVKAALSSK